RARHHQSLQALLLGIVGDGDERALHVAEGRQHGSAVDLQRRQLLCFGQIQLPLKTKSVEYGLGEVSGDLIKRRLRREQQLEYGTLVAALPSERDAGKERGARESHSGVGGGEIGLRGADVGPLE